MVDTTDNDAELFDRWVAGDGSAANALIGKHFETLHRFFVNKVPDADRDDVVQETFAACVEARENFRRESSFRTFLVSIAHKKLLRYYRTKRRKQDKLDPLTHSVAQMSVTGISTKMMHGRQAQALMNALRKLPIGFQIVLELKYWERLTAHECGLVLDLPTNTVSSRIRRAKAELGKLVKEQPEFDGAVVDDPIGAWMAEVREILGADPRELRDARPKKATDG